MLHDEMVKDWNHNKTCKVCAWGQDGFCKKPNKNPEELMSECFVDPLDIKKLFTKQTPNWGKINIPGVQFVEPNEPIVWEDDETTIEMSGDAYGKGM